MPGLEDLYREIILDHYRTPRNRGELAPPAVRAEGHNPLCGDEIQVYLDVTDGIVNDIKVHLDLVAAQRVVTLGAHGRRGEFATVARGAVVIEDDLAVEVFEAGHEGPFVSRSSRSAAVDEKQ